MFFFSSRRRHTRFDCDWSSDVCSSDLVVLGIVVFATGASLMATAALGLISFVPLLGLTVLPLQLAAWLFRGLVFQYVALSSIGAYLKLYRSSAATADGMVFADWAAESAHRDSR